MKKEWLVQLIALLIYYLDYTLDMHGEKGIVIQSLGKTFVFIFFHAVLFFTLNYALIPRLFYKKRYLLFFVILILLISLFGVIEEGLLEKFLYPNSRGRNPVNLISIYYFFGEIFVPLLGFASIKILFDNIDNQQKIEQIEKDSLKNELKFLKSQIQPHILFNSLNNLYEYTLSKSDKAPEIVLQLSNVLRYVLYETSSELVPLSKELTFVQDYVALQIVQLEGRGEVTFNLEEKYPMDDQLSIAPFLLIPFIENGFKHSSSTKVGGIEVTIKVLIHSNKITLIVHNNFDEKNRPLDDLTTKGIGLKNVRKRLELLYFNRYELKIEGTDDFYKVRLDLNLQ